MAKKQKSFTSDSGAKVYHKTRTFFANPSVGVRPGSKSGQRSPARDVRRRSKRVIPIEDAKGLVTWSGYPGRFDVEGVDDGSPDAIAALKEALAAEGKAVVSEVKAEAKALEAFGSEPAAPARKAKTREPKPKPITVAEAHFIGGDQVEYTGKTRVMPEGPADVWYEYRILEGHQKGLLKWTTQTPEGLNPMQERSRREAEAQARNMAEGVAKMREAGTNDQLPPVTPRRIMTLQEAIEASRPIGQEDTPAARERRAKALADEAKALEALKARRGRHHESYTQGMTPLREGVALKGLESTRMHQGEVKTVGQIVDEYLSKGADVVTTPKGERRLALPDGVFLAEKQLSKSGLDYATHVLALGLNTEPTREGASDDESAGIPSAEPRNADDDTGDVSEGEPSEVVPGVPEGRGPESGVDASGAERDPDGYGDRGSAGVGMGVRDTDASVGPERVDEEAPLKPRRRRESRDESIVGEQTQVDDKTFMYEGSIYTVPGQYGGRLFLVKDVVDGKVSGEAHWIGKPPASLVQPAIEEPEQAPRIAELASPTPNPIHDHIIDRAALAHDAGAKARFDANVAAIALAQKLSDEDRLATPEEKTVLAQYSGFGDSAMNDMFPNRWGDINDKPRAEALKALLTPEEYHAIERSRTNAFYTTPTVVDSMWEGVKRLGGDSLPVPRILEPSAGSGRFLGLQPVDMAARSKRTAVELDTTTARVLGHLYPATTTYPTGYEKAPIPNDSIDVAISNVPFGRIPIADREFAKGSKKAYTSAVHNYFFGKTMDKLRPGGVMAFVTSHGTLDAPANKRVRELLYESGDLVGAIRLPNNAFPDTSVVTDIIYIRKRKPGEEPGDDTWVNSSPVTFTQGEGYYKSDVSVHVNDYFREHPEMVLGTINAEGSMYSRRRGEGELTVEPSAGVDLGQALAKATATLPENVLTPADTMDREPRSIARTGAGLGKRPGAYYLAENGQLMQASEGGARVASLTPTDEERVQAMLAIRDHAREVVRLQVEDADDSLITEAQARLNEEYDRFFKKHGALNARANETLMHDDPDSAFLLSLEKLDANGKVPKGAKAADLKMGLFKERVIHGKSTPTISTEADAVAVALNERGRLDFDYIASLSGKTPDAVKQNLVESGIIYKNPAGDFEMADEYLSGYVREKLEAARIAAASNPAYERNVKALEAVQPEDLPPSAIQPRLGAVWIPPQDIDAFIRDTLQADRWVRGQQKIYDYVPLTGEWIRSRKYQSQQAMEESVWGTPAMPAATIVDKLLNGKPIEVSYTDSEGKRIKDEQATLAAQAKAEELSAAFEKWIWTDPERAERLSRYYNDHFNNIRSRVFDGSHQTFPGMNERWSQILHEHQKDAIWRVVSDRTALLAHEVGFGKTAVMVAAGMELRRLGQSRKNMYVVPKATHAQFVSQFRAIYPGAKILAPTEADFTPAERARFMNKIATGDWDAVVVADSQFTKIPVRPETELRFIRDQIEDLRVTAQALAESGEGSKSHKDIQKQLQIAEAKLQKKVDEIAERRDVKGLNFEDMGVDQLFVDEADMFKNLQFATNMGRIKGLPNGESQRAWDMFMKTRWLQKEGGAGGVVFATGTPVSNTIAELWTTMRYLQHPMLEEKGLQSFDAWARTFGETTRALEQTPTGAFRVTSRFSKFNNIPELSAMWQQVADVRVAAEVPEMLARQPRLVNDKRQTVVVPRSPELAEYMQELGERAKNLSGMPEKGGDNMLAISSDARKAALDMRLVKPEIEVGNETKAAYAAKNIASIYHETKPEKGTQIVFLDLGTPKATDKVSEAPAADAWADDEETGSETAQLTSVYADIKGRLISQGVAEDEIAFIHDANTDKRRLALFDKVNRGEVRVLIGSTGKMGAGVNVQERAAALHHLDVPWKPRDIEQREGRIIRQGNIVYGPKYDDDNNVADPGKGVQIYNYVTEGSFDGFMWQAVENKAKAIKSMVKRNTVSRNTEDVDDFVLSASEAKALASGNPDVMRQAQLRTDLQRLASAAGSHKDAMVRARQALTNAPMAEKAFLATIKALETDVAKAKPVEEFSMSVGTAVFKDRKEAGEAIKALVSKAPYTTDPTKAEEIGRYRGFKVKAFKTFDGVSLMLVSPETGEQYQTIRTEVEDLTALGASTRLDNKINAIPNQLEIAKTDLQRLKDNIKTYESQANRPFERQAEMEQKAAELREVEARLQGLDKEETGE